MTFEEWWEAHKDVPLPKPVELAFRAAFEAGQRYEREACAKVCDEASEETGGISVWDSATRCCARLIRMRSIPNNY